MQYETWTFDGGKDIHTNLALSGEPIAPQLEIAFGSAPSEEKTATEIAATNVKLREYRTRYLDYWNSTSALTGTGRPVDAFISAIAPFAAPLPRQYTHNAYSAVINVLDYVATVLPVTTADQALDPVDVHYQPLSAKDRTRHDNCMTTLLYVLTFFAKLFLQMIQNCIMVHTSVCRSSRGGCKRRESSL